MASGVACSLAFTETNVITGDGTGVVLSNTVLQGLQG